MLRRTLLTACLALFAVTAILGIPAMAKAENTQTDLENTVYLDLPAGRVVIRLRPDLAPQHVERVKLLCREGFYDGTPFHRVIEGFMAQGGDPTGTGTGGSKYPNLPAEFSQTEHFVRGTVGAGPFVQPEQRQQPVLHHVRARAQPRRAVHDLWATSCRGMDIVDKIKRGAGGSGTVKDPDRIVHMRVAADVK